jgi:hypothetical protein
MRLHTGSVVTHATPWWYWLLPLPFAAPWIVGIVYFWRHRIRDGAVPLSMADAARRRLWQQ